MMTVVDVKAWLDTLSPGSKVGIDEDGLRLYEVSSENKMTEAYVEVGGIPDEVFENS